MDTDISDFPSNYNQLLLESIDVCNEDEKKEFNRYYLNGNGKKSKIVSKVYQNDIGIKLSKNSHSIKKVNGKTFSSINKVVDILNNSKNSNVKFNKVIKSIPSKINIQNDNKSVPFCNTDKVQENRIEIKDNDESINEISIIYNKDDFNNIQDNLPINNKNIIDRTSNINNKKNVRKKKNKKVKMEPPTNDFDIEFPIIRNPNSIVVQDKNNDKKDILQTKIGQKQKLMENIEVFNKKLLNDKEMDKFLNSKKSSIDYTNDLSIIDKVVLDDVSKKIIPKNNNDITSNELTDANGTANTSNSNNKNLRSHSNNNSRSFNSNFNQFSRNIDKSRNNSFGDNNDNNGRNEGNTNENGENSSTSKLNVSNKEIRKIRRALRRAAVDCSERGLFQASKWYIYI